MQTRISESIDDNLDPEEVERMIKNLVLSQDVQILTCEDYT
jgi:Ca2+-binding EF-hand superfamily protein